MDRAADRVVDGKAVRQAHGRVNRKAQSWSMDLIMGVVLFLLIVTIFYAFSSKNQVPRSEVLQQEGENIATKLDTSAASGGKYPVITNGVISEQNVQALYNTPYDQLKQDLQVQGDFCIYMEDDQGNVITVGNKIGAGNDTLSVSGVGCGQSVPP